VSQCNDEAGLRWYAVDLHIHTPASSDFLRPIPGPYPYLEILRVAKKRGLSAIAITDHNTVAGVAALRREVETLLLLERLERLTSQERDILAEYRQLLEEILVLPGFEFTATFGFHVLGIFPSETPVRKLELLLLQLKVPYEKLDHGSTEVGATVDVLQAYEAIATNGGLVIAAHANANNGVAMLRFGYGGQTRIAYTQDRNLHALEVTDLESRARNATARLFDGTRKEYPRRMHCIQGSDAHVLERLPTDRPGVAGVGDRATELLLPSLSFSAIKDLFLSENFDRHRPYHPMIRLLEQLEADRKEGQGPRIAFYEGPVGSRTVTYLVRDVAAMSNGAGGTIYVGAGPRPGSKIRGVDEPELVREKVVSAISEAVMPEPDVAVDILDISGKKVVVIRVEPGREPPYVIAPSQVYVRSGAESRLATREELVALISSRGIAAQTTAPTGVVEVPRSGVEIVACEDRAGVLHYSMCDLRTGKVVDNVTRYSARSLWKYAILEHEQWGGLPPDMVWVGNRGVRRMQMGSAVRYDLALRLPDGRVRVFYGVTPDGVPPSWKPAIDAIRVAVDEAGRERATEVPEL
jgi:hypothetical protein